MARKTLKLADLGLLIKQAPPILAEIKNLLEKILLLQEDSIVGAAISLLEEEMISPVPKWRWYELEAAAREEVDQIKSRGGQWSPRKAAVEAVSWISEGEAATLIQECLAEVRALLDPAVLAAVKAAKSDPLCPRKANLLSYAFRDALQRAGGIA